MTADTGRLRRAAERLARAHEQQRQQAEQEPKRDPAAIGEALTTCFRDLVVHPLLVRGHVMDDGTLRPFVHHCPGPGCAVQRYLAQQWEAEWQHVDAARRRPAIAARGAAGR